MKALKETGGMISSAFSRICFHKKLICDCSAIAVLPEKNIFPPRWGKIFVFSSIICYNYNTKSTKKEVFSGGFSRIMQIKNLSLQNFRNYENETFAFDGGLNILFGKNAQGKTNCAEAVFYLCTGTSLRIRHDSQLIRIGAPCAKIAADAETRYGKVRIEADIYEDRREIRINGARIPAAPTSWGTSTASFSRPGNSGSSRTAPTSGAGL